MKCEQILSMTSCEFDERAREVKICYQSRPALYYSQQQVDRQGEKLETSAKLWVLVWNTAVSRKVVLQAEKSLRDNVESYFG